MPTVGASTTLLRMGLALVVEARQGAMYNALETAAVWEPLVCRAIVAAAMHVCPRMVADALDTCGVVTCRPSPSLSFVDRLLFPSFWLHQINGRKASEFPLLRDTAIGKAYPGVMSVHLVPFSASKRDTADCPALGDPLSSLLTYCRDDLATLLYLSPAVACFPPPSQGADVVIAVTMRTSDVPFKDVQACFAFHLGGLRCSLTEARLEQAKAAVTREGLGMGTARWRGPRGERSQAMAAILAESPVVGWVISPASTLSNNTVTATPVAATWQPFDALICVDASVVAQHAVLWSATTASRVHVGTSTSR